ncbi:hypothetical protein DEJ50_01390 [Streptomyces venezuelae]|uniref:Carrier domain-containing protein n=2 Tax=Streptomyces venezuelae TaxID=54571 RepID=A0A5P2CUV5_STRVZ|nr:hypothetical protein DEJ50_01390 [Streptomyces venezuelae]
MRPRPLRRAHRAPAQRGLRLAARTAGPDPRRVDLTPSPTPRKDPTMPNDQTTHQTAPATTAASVPATAETVRRIWAELLEVDPESIDVHHSDFFELGGYSLLALQAIGRLLAEQGVDEVEAVELEGALLNRLFEDATPLAQAECLLTATTPTTS